jgi:hypothetical protein
MDQPLVNPTPRDVSQFPEGYNDAENPYSNRRVRGQMHLPQDSRSSRFKQLIGSVKLALKRRIDYMEVAQLWKNPSIPFLTVTFATNMIILFVGGILAFRSLPPELQLFYDPVEETWHSQDKIVHIVIIPVILGILFLIQYKFIKIIFQKDRRLSITISWIMTILNIFLLIAISQIYTLNSA